MYEKKISYEQEKNSDSKRKFVQIYFPVTTKKMTQLHNCIVHKYVRNTKNYFPPEPKKLTQHHNCMEL